MDFNMIKRVSILFMLAVCFLFLLPLTARADVIVGPDNDFYTRHWNDCTYLGRRFYTNGEAGFVSITRAPGSKTEIAAFENGVIILIQFTYNHEGQLWGASLMWDSEVPDGWIPMDQLLVVYDHISFEEDHQGAFYQYSGDYGTLFGPGDIIFWTWPGSGEIEMTHESHLNKTEIERDWLTAERAFMDSEGREWLYIPYFYAHRSTWICLSDPSNGEIPAFNPAPQPELWPSAEPPASSGGPSIPFLIIMLVAVLAAGTIVLNFALRKRTR